jgi:PhzF family phenazine biosynthesis protein
MKTYLVDSFTKEPFKGNPAAVCFPKSSLTEELMLKIAREFGLSETAFVQPTGTPDIFSIRYFSPKKEIPLCGHATLASAKIVFQDSDIRETHFITVNNLNLKVKRQGEDIIMEFPVYDTITQEPPPLTMLKALGLTDIVYSAYSMESKIILLEIADSEILAGLHPDFTALLNSYKDIHGVLVTAPSKNKEYDYQYRYFWPWAGTDEDPVTGGVQTFLAKYWSLRLNKKIMKTFQPSQRTGYMTVEWENDKVLLTSQAVVILEGNLNI